MLRAYSNIKTTKENKKYVKKRLKDFKVKFLIDEDVNCVSFLFFENDRTDTVCATIAREIGATHTKE